jgi:hypothetical protein
MRANFYIMHSAGSISTNAINPSDGVPFAENSTNLFLVEAKVHDSRET